MNSRFTTFLTLFALVGVLFSPHLFAATVDYEDQVINTITVNIDQPTGGALYSPTAIKNRLKSREGALFSQAMFDSDLKMLIQDFGNVDPSIHSVNGKIEIRLTLSPRARIKTIRWEGNQRVTTSTLQGELGISAGGTFDRQKFNEGFHKVKAYYVKKGFFEARLSYDIERNPDTNAVDITVFIDEGRAGKVADIVFVNFTYEEECELIEMIYTKKYNFLMSWLSDCGIYRDEAVQQDRYVILNYLHNEGYSDANVEIEVREASRKNRIILYITADRGEQYTFGGVTIEGNTLYSDDEILRCLYTQEGTPYSPEAIQYSMQNITNLYGRLGYIDAYADYEPRLSPDGCSYSLHINIHEGEQYRVGLIKIFGNTCTQSNLILHETLLVPGELFNLEKLQRTEERLMNVGYFGAVNVYAVQSSGPCGLGDNYRDVHIEVEETSTGNLSGFAGLSNNQGVFGGVTITESNFNAEGLACLFTEGTSRLRGGGEYASATLSIGDKTRSYQLSWTKPYFMDTLWSIGIDADKSSSRYISNAYDINAWGAMLHGTYQHNAFLRSSIHYRFRNSYTKLHGDRKKEDYTPPEAVATTDETAKFSRKAGEEDYFDYDPGLRNLLKANGSISAVGGALIYDSTNHPIIPNCGFRSRLETEITGLGGQFYFFSIGYLNSYYYPITSRLTLKLRADAQFIAPFGRTTPRKNGGKIENSDVDGLPLDERLFLGGNHDIRGYRAFRLGPKVFEKKDVDGEIVFRPSKDPRGGASLQYFSGELIYDLHRCADLFAFVDSGALSEHSWRFDKQYTSLGFGARVDIIPGMPPITIGYGYPLTSTEHNEIKRFFITVGGYF